MTEQEREIKMEKYCEFCESFHNVKSIRELREYNVKGTNLKVELSILKCTQCNNEVYDRENEIKNDIIVFDEYKRINNLLTSSEIMRIRDRYNLSQASFAKLLGFGAKTITRYENGMIQDVTHDRLMRLMDDENNLFFLYKLNKEIFTSIEAKKITKIFNKDLPIITEYQVDERSDNYNTLFSKKGELIYECK